MTWFRHDCISLPITVMFYNVLRIFFSIFFFHHFLLNHMLSIKGTKVTILEYWMVNICVCCVFFVLNHQLNDEITLFVKTVVPAFRIESLAMKIWTCIKLIQANFSSGRGGGTKEPSYFFGNRYPFEINIQKNEFWTNCFLSTLSGKS